MSPETATLFATNKKENQTMDLGLKGKNAIVLGGTRGIGRAIAATLAGEGGNVAVCARNAEQVAATVTELKASGIRATGGTVDVTDGAALKAWVEGAAKELGGIDLLFANAGAMAQGHDARIVGAEFPARRARRRACVRRRAAVPRGQRREERRCRLRHHLLDLGGAGRCRQLLRPDQGGADPHGQGTGAAIRKEEDPRQRGLARHRLFQGRRLEHDRAEHARALQRCDEAQSDGPHGNAAGDRERGGVPGKPGVGVHHRLQSHRGRRDLEPGEFLSEINSSPIVIAERSEAIQIFPRKQSGLLRFARNDGCGDIPSHILNENPATAAGCGRCGDGGFFARAYPRGRGDRR